MTSSRVFILAVWTALVCVGAPAFGQSNNPAIGIPVERQNLPPVAAPTNTVAVETLPIVRSDSQGADDFAAGLIEGLVQAHAAPGIALVVVKEDHVMVARSGGATGIDTPIMVGSLADIFRAVAAMQLVEQAKLLPDEDVSKVLREAGPRGITTAGLLTHQGNPERLLLADVIAKASGENTDAYIGRHIFAPLAMTKSGISENGFTTTASDMGRLLAALLNGGGAENRRILVPASVDLMERTHFTEHPALPGWSYGFVEMRRNGWRALQHDGERRAPAPTQSRLVLIPEAKIGYFAVVSGDVSAETWRALDDSLFDKLAPPRAVAEAGLRGIAAPGSGDAQTAAGTYVPNVVPYNAVWLKVHDERLKVAARPDGALVLSGAEDAVLAPHAGGYWQDAKGDLSAALRDGRLIVNFGLYRPLPPWERGETYGAVALLAGFGAAGAGVYRSRKRRPFVPTNEILALGGACFSFLILSLLVWLLAPAI